VFLPRDATHSAVMRLHVVCPSVCLSVTFRYRDHIGWNTSKIISRQNSVRRLRWPQHRESGPRGKPPKLGWNSLCLCEIIPCVLLTYRVGVHWGVARVCPRLQRALAAPDCCTLFMPIKGSNTRPFSQLSLCVLFIVTIRLRWRWIMMTAVNESDYMITCLRQLCDLRD